MVNPEPFADEIQAIEARIGLRPPPAGCVVFAGSSTIRLWAALETDFRAYHAVNCGFGGSTIAQNTHVAPRIIIPCRPRRVYLYAGDNDIAGGLTAAQVASDFRAFVATLRAKLPAVPVTFISIKPSPSRWHLAGVMCEANDLIRAASAAAPGLDYVDIYRPMLGPDRKPNPALYIEDQLHMSLAGYAIWKLIIGDHLACNSPPTTS